MTVNTARFDEGTEILLDWESISAGHGVTLTYATVHRIGTLVVLHIEGTIAASTLTASSPNTLATVPADYVPAQAITPLGVVTGPTATALTLDTGGNLKITPSSTVAGTFVFEAQYEAAVTTP